jgi:hypothetical protein
MKFLLVSLFAACIAFAGCKSSTGPSGGSLVIGPNVVPGIGSTYLYLEEYRDSSGVWHFNDTLHLVIMDTGLSVQGKTNLLKVRQWSVPDNDLFYADEYWHYELNGDVNVYTDMRYLYYPQSAWSLYPFATQQASTFSYYDTAYTGNTMRIDTTNDVMSGGGTGSFTLNGHTFATEKVLLTYHGNSTLGTSSFTGTTQFAPQLGQIVAQDYSSYYNAIIGRSLFAHRRTLISYELK